MSAPSRTPGVAALLLLLLLACGRLHPAEAAAASRNRQRSGVDQSKQRDTSSGAVTVLDLENYKQHFPNPKEPWIIVYQAPWCGACNLFKPVFARIAEQAQDRRDSVLGVRLAGLRFGSVNCELSPLLCEGAPHYPHVLYVTKDRRQRSAAEAALPSPKEFGAAGFGSSYTGQLDRGSFQQWLINTHQRLQGVAVSEPPATGTTASASSQSAQIQSGPSKPPPQPQPPTNLAQQLQARMLLHQQQQQQQQAQRTQSAAAPAVPTSQQQQQQPQPTPPASSSGSMLEWLKSLHVELLHEHPWKYSAVLLAVGVVHGLVLGFIWATSELRGMGLAR